MSQTYRTRHLTARDHELVDRLARFPRYAALVERLRPSSPAPAKPKAGDDDEDPNPKASRR